MPPLLTVKRRNHGIYLPDADLYLDPPRSVARAFISHAHSDHVAKHRLTFASELTLQLMRERYRWRDRGEECALKLREPRVWEGWELRLVPAGHIVGSTMLHLTRQSDGATLLYTGDYKLRQGLSTERCELIQADTLIMESTFGLPKFAFPPLADTVAAILRFTHETLQAGGIPVLLGYSLGKAQEILCALADSGVPVMLHDAAWKMTQSVKHVLGELPDYRPFSAANAAGHALIFPPNLARSEVLMQLKGCRTAVITGWAINPSAKYRYQADEAFPLSDHADHAELIETVETVCPRRVYVVHGSTQAFASDLRTRGYDARTLDHADQLELLL